jgi:DNA-directed RNA polymerase subunit M
MIQFCPKCKSILRPKKEDDKVIMFCSCGYTSDTKGSGSLKDDKKVKKEEAELAVVDKEIETLPITKAECPKCGNGEAYYWTVQTRSADEAETKFLKCTKCKKTWRDYD